LQAGDYVDVRHGVLQCRKPRRSRVSFGRIADGLR
jgi:hypothetical protein